MFFTLNERDGKSIKQDTTATEFRNRTSQYAKMGMKSHPASTAATPAKGTGTSEVYEDKS